MNLTQSHPTGSILIEPSPPRRPGWRHLLQVVTASRTNYWASYVIDLACPLTLGYLGWRASNDWRVAVASLGAGALTFSFVEYAIHRWLFHSPGCFMSAIHQTHHADPEEPTALPCISSAVVAVVAWSALTPLAGPQIACFFLSGFLAWYFWYGALHHLEHHLGISGLPLRWLQRKWATHAVHHRLAHTNFGVTTSLWDHVFGTHYQSKRR